MCLFQKFAVLLLIFAFAAISCKKESFYTGQEATLRFSNDTVTFDTIFSSIGTPTKQLMVYNPYQKSIKISSIQLAGKSTSPFIININGKQVNSLNDVEIYPKDSLYIFIQIFIAQTGQNLPLLVRDSLEFVVNGNIQYVNLIAYGQDVHLIKDGVIKTSVWDADKPYLVYGKALVDTLETLTISKGTTIFFHKQSNLYVKGTLNVQGEFTQPVIFRGDRLEKDYKDYPGQWGGIILLPGSKNNIFNWVVVKNGTAGIQIGAYNDFSKPDIELSNVIVQNMSYSCLLAIGAKIKADNCLIADAADYTCGLIGGGDYEFYHCTFANYYGNYLGADRKFGYPTLYISNYYSNPANSSNKVFTDLTKADFYNSIIYGSNTDEIKLDSVPSALFQCKFDHCLLESKEYANSSNNPPFSNIIWNKDPKFKTVDSLKYELDTLSAAKDAGDIDIGKLYPLDLKNRDRTKDKAPDLGAYERVE